MIDWKLPQRPSRLRHPLARLAAAVRGIVVVVAIGLFALGALVIGVVVIGGAMLVRRFARPAAPAKAEAARPAPRGAAIDGEFVVIDAAHTRRP